MNEALITFPFALPLVLRGMKLHAILLTILLGSFIVANAGKISTSGNNDSNGTGEKMLLEKLVRLRQSRRMRPTRKEHTMTIDAKDLIQSCIDSIGSATYHHIRKNITYCIEYEDRCKNVLLTSPYIHS